MNNFNKLFPILAIALTITACGQVIDNPNHVGDNNLGSASETPALSNVPKPLTNAVAKPAGEFYEKARDLAFAKAEDAQLVRIDTQHGTDFSAHVPADGMAPHWLFSFDSKSNGTQYNVTMSSKKAEIFNESPQIYNPDTVIPDGWIDTVEAFEIAQSKGGKEYLESRLNKPVFFTLNVDPATGKPVWHVRYSANPTEGLFNVDIDALTKEVLNVEQIEPLTTEDVYTTN
jgi:hypothetical protein